MEKLKSNEDIKRIICTGKKVVMYGAGGVGEVLMAKFMHEYPNISLSVAVTAKDGYPYYLFGKKVLCIDDFIDVAGDSIVIIATLEEKQEGIFDYLEKLGFHEVYGITDAFYEYLKEINAEQYQNGEVAYYNRYVEPFIRSVIEICKKYQIEGEQRKRYVENALENMKDKKISLPRVVVVLGNKCSLRCRDCNNLMPYFKHPKELNVEKILRSLKILLSKTNTILKYELIGGEPFLSDNLSVVLEFLLKQEKVYQIEITTNGMILPKQEQIPLLQDRRVMVRISDYGTLVDKQKMITCLSQSNISYEILDGGKWIDSGEPHKRYRNIKELKDIYHNCYVGYFCKVLYEDKLFACPRASSLYALGYMKEQEYITIEERITVGMLNEFLTKTYSDACDYCGRTKNLIFVEPAIQL